MTDTSPPYKVGHKELATLLVKHFGIHEGYWMLQAHFSLGALNAGPDLDNVSPTALVGVAALGIKQVPELAPASLTVDAAAVNPAPTAKAAAKRARKTPAKAN